jgi:hypothetical protein
MDTLRHFPDFEFQAGSILHGFILLIVLWQAGHTVLKKHREARLKDMISLRRAIIISSYHNLGEMEHTRGTTQIARQFPTVPLRLFFYKPYAFTQQSRMSSTRIPTMQNDAYGILSSHRLGGYKSSADFKRLPPP